MTRGGVSGGSTIFKFEMAAAGVHTAANRREGSLTVGSLFQAISPSASPKNMNEMQVAEFVKGARQYGTKAMWRDTCVGSGGVPLCIDPKGAAVRVKDEQAC